MPPPHASTGSDYHSRHAGLTSAQVPIGAVMAGGAGSRMGRQKAAVALAGRPLITYPLGALADAKLETVVVAKAETKLLPLEVAVWGEPSQPAHPLCGIVTALRRAGGRPVVVCGCDMPFLTGRLLARIAAEDAPLVLPEAGARLHPLVARYGPALLDPLESALGARRALQEVVSELDPVVIGEDELSGFGDPERLLFNVNTAADLAQAERLLQELG